jgi:poly(A) polymerase
MRMMDLKQLLKPQVLLPLTTISNFLVKQDIKSYLVGGVIRDVILERSTADIDITIEGDALEIARQVATALGGKYVLLNETNRMGRVVLSNKEGWWEIDFSTLKGSIEQDLAQRDFTIDAMAVDLSQLGKEHIDGMLIDPFHGWDDVQHGVIRVVTETAFESDAVRLLRAVRLAAELGFTIDKETEALIRNYAYLISGVAGERTREELLRLFAVPQASKFLPYLDELGLVTAIIPELIQEKGVEQPKEHFWNVFTHSLETVAAVDFLLRQGNLVYAGEEVLGVAPWPSELVQHFASEVSHGSTRGVLLKLAALLHDVAKPQTRTIEADGRMRFLGHAQDGAAMVVNILGRLRFSTREVKLVETMVRHHLRPMQMSHEGLPSRRAIYRYFRDTAEAGIDTLILSLADHLATRGPRLELAQWREHSQLVEHVINHYFQEEKLVKPPKLVDGHDLISIFGISPGPRMGELIEALCEAQATGELTTRGEALNYIDSLLKGVHG